jgi:endonuclease/exonuclease/phosphatase family metal-dependent hydrolase
VRTRIQLYFLKEAQRIAKNFSIEDCTTQILGLYEKARTSKYINRTTEEHGTWQSVMHRIKTEWDMLKNMAEAGQAALHTSNDYSPRKKFPDDKTLIKSRGAPLIMKIRRWLKEPTSQPGLVLIQIDGFSMTQLNRALKDGEMPFLKKLLNKERYNLYPYYSGLPSSTPSIQGELFYGVKGSVPSFSFLDHKEKKVLRMYDFEAAVEVERRLAQHNKGLLEGGSSYSNIFAGGAQESHFCAVNLGWHVLWKGAHPLRLFILALTHIHEFIRTVVLMAVEMILAIIDFIQGLMRGENLGKELKFIPTRAGICIMLRDLITIGAKIDISRGLPVVHMNFLGYDEQAHRRGPTTSFAHWALQGIDASVAKIYRAALRSTRRNYDVWIYSDHGQEGTLSYAFEYGRTIQEAVASVFENFGGEADSLPSLSSDLMKSQYRRGIQFHRARYLGGRLFQKIFRITGKPDDEQAYKRLVVTAMGPIGHIYIPLSMEKDQRNQFARRLVIEAKIPLVLAPDGQGQARCWNESGEFILPAQAKEVLGENHPYLTEVTQDLKELCHHPNAGTLIISGWRPNLEPYSFPIEGGAHGGPGSEETNAFAILPSDIVLSLEDRTYLRTKDLREAALSLLEGFQPEQSEIAVNSAAPKSFAETRTIRIMTYNVHSCIGMDGKITPERIARVIGRHEPDIVALQELDMRRPRTGGIDQPHLIARHLAMIYHFYPTIRIEEERYGNAVLSRYPMKLIYAGRLPGLSGNNNIEPRGAIWSTVDIGNTRIQLINTHLGLRRRERLDQVKAILGKDWLSHPDCSGPVVLCGDFNALPRSPVCRRIRRRLRDAQSDMEDHRPRATWFGHFPMGRIDHVFVGPNIEICHVEVSRTELDKIASDHLPLIVDIKIPVHL